MNKEIEFLLSRQSTSILTEPVPNKQELQLIFQVALTVPDHGKLKPYRFVVLSSENQEKFADALSKTILEKNPNASEQEVSKARQKAYAAPLQIVIISCLQEAKIPNWEQEASAACTGYAITLAAHALGFGAIWKSFGGGIGTVLKTLFNLKDNESVLGWINIGTPKTKPNATRQFPDLDNYVSFI